MRTKKTHRQQRLLFMEINIDLINPDVDDPREGNDVKSPGPPCLSMNNTHECLLHTST